MNEAANTLSIMAMFFALVSATTSLCTIIHVRKKINKLNKNKTVIDVEKEHIERTIPQVNIDSKMEQEDIINVSINNKKLIHEVRDIQKIHLEDLHIDKTHIDSNVARNGMHNEIASNIVKAISRPPTPKNALLEGVEVGKQIFDVLSNSENGINNKDKENPESQKLIKNNDGNNSDRESIGGNMFFDDITNESYLQKAKLLTINEDEMDNVNSSEEANIKDIVINIKKELSLEISSNKIINTADHATNNIINKTKNDINMKNNLINDNNLSIPVHLLDEEGTRSPRPSLNKKNIIDEEDSDNLSDSSGIIEYDFSSEDVNIEKDYKLPIIGDIV